MNDRQLIADLLSALEYHTEQTRPIQFSKVAIEAAREYLRKPAQQPAQQEPVAWVGLNDDDLDGYTKSNVLMVRHFERVIFERNTQPCLEGLPEPIRTPPEKGTQYWTIGLGRWTWGGTTHDYSSLGKGIWRCETDVWKVHAAIRRALGIESNIAAVFQNRHEAKLREKNHG